MNRSWRGERARRHWLPAVQRVEAHLVSHPDDGRGYEIVAPIYLETGRFDDAVRAFGEALRILGVTPQREGAYGLALVMAADGVVTTQAPRRLRYGAEAGSQPAAGTLLHGRCG